MVERVHLVTDVARERGVPAERPHLMFRQVLRVHVPIWGAYGPHRPSEAAKKQTMMQWKWLGTFEVHETLLCLDIQRPQLCRHCRGVTGPSIAERLLPSFTKLTGVPSTNRSSETTRPPSEPTITPTSKATASQSANEEKLPPLWRLPPADPHTQSGTGGQVQWHAIAGVLAPSTAEVDTARVMSAAI